MTGPGAGGAAAWAKPADRDSISEAAAASLLSSKESLSDREFEVLRLLASGLGPTEVAAKLHLSVKTVSTHKAHIQQKLGVSSTAELVRYALEHKLVE